MFSLDTLRLKVPICVLNPPLIVSTHLNQGIVLGHVIFNKGIEVDKAKVELISKLPPGTNVKAVRQFLGHVGFYMRFIKDFSKIVKPLCELLVKDTNFVFGMEGTKRSSRSSNHT